MTIPDRGTPRPWPEGVIPSPEALAQWLGDCTDAERLVFAMVALANSQAATDCMTQDHAHRIEWLEARQKIATNEVRREAAEKAWDEGREHGLDEDLCRLDLNPYRDEADTPWSKR